MAKMNPRIIMTKGITGYRTARKLNGDAGEKYTAVTNVDVTEATVYDKANAVVGVVQGNGLKDLVKKIMEGLVEKGVKFPIVTVDDVPFVTETIYELTFEPFPFGGLEFVTGTYTLEYNGNTTSALTIKSDATAIEAAIQSLEGLEEATVTGNVVSGYTITLPVPNAELTVATNTLTYAPKVQELRFEFDPLTRELISGTYSLTDGVGTSDLINYNNKASAVDYKLNAMGYQCAVQAITEEGQTVGFTIKSLPGSPDLTVSTNTLQSDLIGSPGSPDNVDITITDKSPAPEDIDVVLA